jgi:hypothetical protein
MKFHRMPAQRWLWTAAALILVMVALSPIPAEARQYYTIKRVSVSSTGVQGINIQDPVINDNGTVIAFWSDKEGLVPGDTNFAGDVFVHNRANNQTYRVSLGFGGVQTARTDGNLPVSYPDIDISDDGCSVVYSSDAQNITQQNGQQTSDVNNTTDVFLVNWCLGGFPTNANQTLHISKNYGTGQQANGGNTNPKISGGARYVLWRSNANNLVAGDTNNMPDIFLMDLGTPGVPISRVNVGSGGTQANQEDGTMTFDVSDDGNIVVFGSIANNLVPGDTNNQPDIFIRNRAANTTIRINGTGSVQPNNGSFNPTISGDGKIVAFRSNASNLIPGDTNGVGDVFRYEIATGAITRVSVSSEGTQANFPSDRPSINNNGRFISFYSDATSLIYGDTNGSGDIFLHDHNTAITTRVSVRQNGNQGNGPSGQISAISDSGAVIAWESFQDNIVQNDTNASSDVFVSEGGPISPHALTLVNKTMTSASLTWTNGGGTTYDSVIVQRRTEGTANFALRQTLGGTATSFDDTSLTPCTIYYYRVLGVIGDRRSPSNIVRVKTLGCPPGPFTLASPVGGETVINPARADFRWSASEEAATYTFTLNRNGVGQVEQRVINAGDICDGVRCILPVDGGLLADLTNASYSWTVTATNAVCAAPPPGITCPTQASNNPQTFTVNTNLPPRTFPLLAPGDGSLVRNLTTFGGFVWRDNRDAAEYALTVIHVSNNVRLGTVINQQNLTPEADGDGLTCDYEGRTCTYIPTSGERSAMAKGRYSWTVFAESPGSQRTEANNGAFKLKINTNDIELLANGGFEVDANADKQPDGWTVGGITNDKRRCNKPAVTFTPFGSCAFLFKSSAAENSALKQVILDSGYGMGAGDTIRLMGKAEATNLPTGSVKVALTVKYVNNAFPKDKATINIPPGTYLFDAIPQNQLDIDGPVAKITVKIINRATSGKVLLDEFSLLLLGPDTPRGISNDANIQYYPGTRIPMDAARDGSDPLLPPPPPPVDGFRGQN